VGVNRVLSSLPSSADQIEQLIVKAVQMEDRDDLWHWRNDPHTRAQSLNSDSVPFDQHCKWFASALNNPEQFLVLGTIPNKAILNSSNKVGMVRFDLGSVNDASGPTQTRSIDKKAIVSINVNPDFRGKGFSTPLLNMAVEAFKNHLMLPSSVFRHIRFIEAIIKEDNKASIKCFQNAGFAAVNPNNTEHAYAEPRGQRSFRLLLD
jgi:RimJ/RimL family protein N-acetyltransferase